VKKYKFNNSDISAEDSNAPSTISECLGYAKEVSDIFSHSIKSEKEKWKKHRNVDLGCDVEEDVVWKHAKRVAKMIAIQSQNLDHLVELIGESVAKECPNYDVELLKDIAKIGPHAVDVSSSACKDATSKDGLAMLSACETLQSTNEFEEAKNSSKKDGEPEPIAGPSGKIKLTLRKDLFEESSSKTIPFSKKVNSLGSKNCSNSDSMELPLYDTNKDPPVPTNKESELPSTADSVPLPRDDGNGNELREVVVPILPGKWMFPTYFVFIESCDQIRPFKRSYLEVEYFICIKENKLL